MGLFDKIKSAVDPMSGWANPMSYGPQAFNAVSGDKNSFQSMIPGIGDSMATAEANKVNARSAQTQMDFQERMSNSAYQRSMEDMRKAGLNPMLAMSQGGASTPSGSMATAQAAPKTALVGAAMQAATGINLARNQNAALQNTMQDSQQNRTLSTSQTAKNIAETEATQVKTALAKKDIPFAKLKGELTEGASSIIRKLQEGVSNSAKSLRFDEYQKHTDEALRQMRERQKQKGNR